jgi:iron complex outermembrane receptor protein
LSYLHFNYTRVDPNTGVPENGISPFTPEWKWSFGIQYEFSLGNAGTLTPRFDASYQDDIYANSINSPAAAIDSYTLANARLTWRNMDEDLQVALEVNNLFDKLYYDTAFDLIPAFGGFASAQPALPRTWMVSAKYSFH